MKNLSGKTSEAKQSNLLDKRELVLATVFFLTALLIFMAISSMAQTPETFTVIRYGKETLLTKDTSVNIVEFVAVVNGNNVLLQWKEKNIADEHAMVRFTPRRQRGVYAVMRSEDGINYTCVSLFPALKQENKFRSKIDSSHKAAYYQILYISENNTYAVSISKNITIELLRLKEQGVQDAAFIKNKKSAEEATIRLASNGSKDYLDIIQEKAKTDKKYYAILKEIEENLKNKRVIYASNKN